MKRFLTALLGSVILFVVVCPITPTPIAVLSGSSAHVHVAFVPLALPAPGPSLAIDHGALAANADVAPMVPAESLLDLNCTRLC